MDLPSLLPPISDQVPCGPDPEQSELKERWHAFIAADSRDLTNDDAMAVREQAVELAKTTKHVRLAVSLTRCLAQTDGLTGFRDGLQLLWIWSATWPKHLHPVPDVSGGFPEDEEEPNERDTLLRSLGASKTLTRWEKLPLVELPPATGGGSYGLADLEAARATIPHDPARAQQVRAALEKWSSDARLETLAAAHACRTFLTILIGLHPWGQAGKTDPLEKLAKYFTRVIEALRDAPAPAAAASKEEPRSVKTGTQAAAREAISKQLGEAARYFVENEPSSPVPYLLQRAQRCIGKSYMDLIKELDQDSTGAEKALKPPQDS